MGFDSFKNKVRILDASSLKSVIGGSGSCAFMTSDGYVFGGGVSREEAINYSRGGGRWCCDSCHKATWLSDAQKDYLR